MKSILLTFSVLLLLASASVLLPPGASPVASTDATYATTTQDTLPPHGQEMIRVPSYIGEVEFPHLDHVDAFGLDCGECHHETNAATLVIPHEDYFDDFWIDCSICHREPGSAALQAQACSNCHPARPKNIADETLSAKVVIHKNCWACHDSGTGAEASSNCAFCHTGARLRFSPARAGSEEIP
jgi:hypothetical protein